MVAGAKSKIPQRDLFSDKISGGDLSKTGIYASGGGFMVSWSMKTETVEGKI